MQDYELTICDSGAIRSVYARLPDRDAALQMATTVARRLISNELARNKPLNLNCYLELRDANGFMITMFALGDVIGTELKPVQKATSYQPGLSL